MIRTATAAANPYTEKLKSMQSQGILKADYLVIAHPDERMLESLKQALGGNKLVILTVPQSTW